MSVDSVGEAAAIHGDALPSMGDMSTNSAEMYCVGGDVAMTSMLTSDDLPGHGCTACDDEGESAVVTAEEKDVIDV